VVPDATLVVATFVARVAPSLIVVVEGMSE